MAVELATIGASVPIATKVLVELAAQHRGVSVSRFVGEVAQRAALRELPAEAIRSTVEVSIKSLGKAG